MPNPVIWMASLMNILAQNPRCPKGLMQWQHGTYEVSADGSIELEPISVDGRQLMSDPCSFDNSVLTRYNQTEKFKVGRLLRHMLKKYS